MMMAVTGILKTLRYSTSHYAFPIIVVAMMLMKRSVLFSMLTTAMVIII